MKPYHMQDPWVFIRRTLENAYDAKDEETIRRMSEMIDRGMSASVSETCASDAPGQQQDCV